MIIGLLTERALVLEYGGVKILLRVHMIFVDLFTEQNKHSKCKPNGTNFQSAAVALIFTAYALSLFFSITLGTGSKGSPPLYDDCVGAACAPALISRVKSSLHAWHVSQESEMQTLHSSFSAPTHRLRSALTSMAD